MPIAVLSSVTSTIGAPESGRPMRPRMPSAGVNAPSKKGSASRLVEPFSTWQARRSMRSITNRRGATSAPTREAWPASHWPDSLSTSVAVRWAP